MIQHHTPLKRSTKPIARTVAPRKRRKGPPRRGPGAVPANEWRNPEFRAFVRTKPCAACVATHQAQESPTEAAHTGKVNGMSSKAPDRTCGPLCRVHHLEFDSGRRAFQSKYDLDMPAEAEKCWKEFCES